MSRRSRSLVWWGTALAALLVSLPALAQAGPKLRVDLYAPTAEHLVNVDNPNFPQTLFEHDETIPYGSIGSAANGAVQSLANQHGDKEGDFHAGYIDYHYEVDSTASFSFTEPNQPTVTVLSSTENKVRVQVHTKARVGFQATGSATTSDHLPVPPFTEYPDFDGKLAAEVLFSLDATADIALWPTVAVENVAVTLGSGPPVLKITGLEGDMTGTALAVGTTLGFTPGGLIAGGPPALGLVALIGTNAAYDAAVEEIYARLTKAIEKAVADANARLASEIPGLIAPAVSAANQVQSQALNTAIPGIGTSLSGLQSQAGMSFDVRTLPLGAGARVAVTARFDGEPRGGAVVGKVRFPKAQCMKSSKSVGGQKIVIGILQEANGDLAEGMSCSQLFANGDMSGKVFLGITPPGSSLASWNAAGVTLEGKGTLSDVTTSRSPGLGESEGYFECAFELSGLPKGVLEFATNGSLADRLEDYAFSNERRWVLGAGAPWVIGGAGKCDGTGTSGGLTPNKKKEFEQMLEDCPQCGRLGQKPGNTVMNPATRARMPGIEQRAPGLQEKLQPRLREAGAPELDGAQQKLRGASDAIPQQGDGGPDTKGALEKRYGGPDSKGAIGRGVGPASSAASQAVPEVQIEPSTR